MTDDEVWDDIEAQLTEAWCDALVFDPAAMVRVAMGLPELGEAEKIKLDCAIASRAAGENPLIWKLSQP